MATFEYIARIDPSRMQEGTIEAESAISAASAKKKIEKITKIFVQFLTRSLTKKEGRPESGPARAANGSYETVKRL